MIDFKQYIVEKIMEKTTLEKAQVEECIEIPKDEKMGDYAFTCFKLAKIFHKAPNIIAQEIYEKLDVQNYELIDKVEIVGGYINFFMNQIYFIKSVFEQGDFGIENSYTVGNNKNIVIDYSSPNIAKPFHIGHLRTTVIGGALYNIYKYLGYNVTGVNHLGDYGTQFGKLIEGYKRWKDEYLIEEKPIEELTKIYIRINKLCEEDENVLQACRDNFKKLEEGDEYCLEIWKKFKELSLKEFQRVYDLLGSKFDSWNGESFYSDKMDEVIEKLQQSGKLIKSEGAEIVEIGEDTAPCIIRKSNGSTTYATRDLAAILYRARTYNYDKAIYVTSYEQILHFKQVFTVAQLLGLEEKYIKGLEHVPYGMVRLDSGKMSTREGTIVKLEDLLIEAISRARKIIEEKNPQLPNKDEIAKRVGLGAVIFNDLSNNRMKDEIFNWDEVLNFQGETGPYIQYIYVRTKSVLEKAGNPELNCSKINFEYIKDKDTMQIAKLLYQFKNILIQVTEKEEPSILSRYLIDLSQAYSSFYNNNKVLVEEEEIRNARLYVTKVVGEVLKIGAELLGMQMPDRM